VNTFSCRDAEAADELALARLDDAGAPAAVSRPQISDNQGHHAIRRGRSGQVVDRLAQTAAAASGEEAEQTPALPGAG
jgi:hypothetical protein